MIIAMCGLVTILAGLAIRLTQEPVPKQESLEEITKE